MFTGIIEGIGSIRRITASLEGARLEVSAQNVLEDIKPGDSIAVNGVCLTVVQHDRDWFAVDISQETIQRTSLKQAVTGDRVNLERPLMPSSRLGGHIVQGHVDGTGELVEAHAVGEGWIIRIGFPPELAHYIVEKGSVTVDGISLTVSALGETWFEVAIIPHTWEVTNLNSLEPGAIVNLEVDIIAKYVERMMQAHFNGATDKLSLDKLVGMGY